MALVFGDAVDVAVGLHRFRVVGGCDGGSGLAFPCDAAVVAAECGPCAEGVSVGEAGAVDVAGSEDDLVSA